MYIVYKCKHNVHILFSILFTRSHNITALELHIYIIGTSHPCDSASSTTCTQLDSSLKRLTLEDAHPPRRRPPDTDSDSSSDSSTSSVSSSESSSESD